MGLQDVKCIDAETLSAELKDVLVRLNLSPHKMRGRCYDGASCMAGMKSGVATRLSRDEPRAVYTHCYGHALSLACSDAIKQCKVMKESLETTHEITKLIKLSPRRDALFEGFKEELVPDSAGVRALCPHRWTVRAQSLKSILDNYEALCATWEEALDIAKDTETKSRIIGVSTQMKKFDYFFGIMLGELILNHTDNLSRTLQKTTISAAQGQSVAKLTVATLQKIRNDNDFEKKLRIEQVHWVWETLNYLVKGKFLEDLSMEMLLQNSLQVPLSATKSFTLRHLILLLAVLKVDLSSQGTKFTHNLKNCL